MPRPYISPPLSRRPVVALQYITIYLDSTLHNGRLVLGDPGRLAGGVRVLPAFRWRLLRSVIAGAIFACGGPAEARSGVGVSNDPIEERFREIVLAGTAPAALRHRGPLA